MSSNRRGLLVILSSPSGAGKSTLAKRLMNWDPELRFSVSATTRKPRQGETDGVEYFFHTKEEFTDLIETGGMLEHAEVFGNFYGSPLAPVQEAVEAGRDVLFDIDWQGGQQIAGSALKDSVVSIFILPPSISELERRLNNRGQDSEEVISDRMSKSRDEISHYAEYDYVLVNDDLENTWADLRSILSAERMKRQRQPQLVAHVRGLNSEFEDRK
ncbi:MAG: guanylate kinase [Paracoccaceae bacterium]|nr:guanylate kinase [Paracoccaceae bacterium]MDG2259134.1 guanylate kinase [Paracoccaceae bacterium]